MPTLTEHRREDRPARTTVQPRQDALPVLPAPRRASAGPLTRAREHAAAATCRHCKTPLPPRPAGQRGPGPQFCTRRCRSQAKHARLYVPKPRPATAPQRHKHKPGDRFGALVIIERLSRVNGSQYVRCRCDCGTEKRVALQNLTSGAITNCADRRQHPDPRRKATLTYSGAHHRVKYERGSASHYRCPCGRRAEHWAYSHADYDADRDRHGREAGKPFSINPAHYAPMCRSCHCRFDDAQRRSVGDGLGLAHVAFWMATN